MTLTRLKKLMKVKSTREVILVQTNTIPLNWVNEIHCSQNPTSMRKWLLKMLPAYRPHNKLSFSLNQLFKRQNVRSYRSVKLHSLYHKLPYPCHIWASELFNCYWLSTVTFPSVLSNGFLLLTVHSDFKLGISNKSRSSPEHTSGKRSWQPSVRHMAKWWDHWPKLNLGATLDFHIWKSASSDIATHLIKPLQCIVVRKESFYLICPFQRFKGWLDMLNGAYLL